VPSTSILNEGNSPRVRNERLVAQSSPGVDNRRCLAATYLLTASIYWVVTTLAVNDRARAFKALSPGMLSPLGILFALLVGFIAVEVWSNFDKAKAAVATEASALRAVVVLAGTFPEEQKTHIYALVDRHIEEAVNEVWPAMAHHRATLSNVPTALIETLYYTLGLEPADASQRIAQSEMVKAIRTALDARRQRIGCQRIYCRQG